MYRQCIGMNEQTLLHVALHCDISMWQSSLLNLDPNQHGPQNFGHEQNFVFGPCLGLIKVMLFHFMHHLDFELTFWLQILFIYLISSTVFTPTAEFFPVLFHIEEWRLTHFICPTRYSHFLWMNCWCGYFNMSYCFNLIISRDLQIGHLRSNPIRRYNSNRIGIIYVLKPRPYWTTIVANFGHCSLRFQCGRGLARSMTVRRNTNRIGCSVIND